MLSLDQALPDLSDRSRSPELMDDPDLDRDRHHRALRALSRVNRVSLAGARLWREVKTLGREVARPVRVLDLACGGGDVLAYVAERARSEETPVTLHGGDVSPVAVERARARVGGEDEEWTWSAAPAGGEHETDVVRDLDLRFFEMDALEDDLPSGYDLVTSSLFLHHLERAEAIRMLRRMAMATERSIFVQDLRRTRLGYLLAWIGLHTLTRSDVARTDGLRSVRSAFTMAEVRSLCAEAGLQGAEVEARWPQRFTIRWTRPTA